MPIVVKRGLTTLAMIAGVALASVGSGTAEAAVQRGLPNTLQNVIFVLQSQHTDLAIAKGHSSPRVDANHKDQSGLIAKARSKGASNLRGFDTVNAVAATVTPDQAAQLAADPSVAAVFPASRSARARSWRRRSPPRPRDRRPYPAPACAPPTRASRCSSRKPCN